MDERPSSSDERPFSSAGPHSFSRALVVALMVSVLYGAILVAVSGLISLFADIDVIIEPDAGPLVGPLMALTVLAIVFLSVLGGLRPVANPGRIPVGRAIATAASVYLAGPIVGAIAYALVRDEVLGGLPFLAVYLQSPFVIAAAVAALVVILLLPIIRQAKSAPR